MTKPYYEHSGIVIYHGDCREILPNLESSGQGRVIVCDPPYGISHSSSYGASWQDTMIAGDADAQLRDWIVSTCFPGSPMAVFGTWKVARPTEARAVLVWDKGPAFGMGDLSFPWKNSWEEIYILGDGWEGRRDEGVLRGHIVLSWESKGREHPHEKPVSLLKHLIGKNRAGLVLDPTCGTGTTLVAAKELQRSAIGIEIDERYCEIAARRLSQQVLDFSPKPKREPEQASILDRIAKEAP